MKPHKLSQILLVTIILFSSILPIFAQTPTAVVVDAKFTNLRNRAITEIDRRVNSLNKYNTAISENARLIDSQREKIYGDMTNEIKSLTDLKTKINAETNLDSLKQEVKQIVDAYRVYALYLPKIRIILTYNNETILAEKLIGLSLDLNTRINALKPQGVNVTTLQKNYNDLIAKTNSARTNAESAFNAVINLLPADYPANKKTLESGRDSIKKSLADFKAANENLKKIWTELKSIKTTPTPTPKLTPLVF